mgnify:CR=1 FL=1
MKLKLPIILVLLFFLLFSTQIGLAQDRRIKERNEHFEKKSKKEREAEELVRSFMTQKAIQNKNTDMMGYMYRYGENKKDLLQ